MKIRTFFTSFNGAIMLSVISLLIFLGRTFIDFYFVYGEFGMGIGMVTVAILTNMALFGGWIWGLLTAVQGNRRGMVTLFGFNLFFLLAVAVGTLVAYCPSPCRTAWPLGEIANWVSLVIGLLTVVSLGNQLRRRSSQP